MIDTEINQYCFENTSQEPELLLELIQATQQRTGWPNKLSGRIVGRFLKLIVELHKPKYAIEIGMFTGYSALSIAEALPKDGKLFCFESNPKAIDIAQEFFALSPYGQKIKVQFGLAQDFLPLLEDEIDFAFIDADKRNYLHYFEILLPKMKKGSLIVIDNALWSGRVLNPQEQSDISVDKLNQTIAIDSRVENVLLSARDGINLVRVI